MRNPSVKRSGQTPLEPTFAELIPSAYDPVFVPVGFMMRSQTRTSFSVNT